MFSIKADMLIRLEEADGLINLVRAAEEEEGVDFNVINIPVLKASVILVLYNAVESTIKSVLVKIHEEINSRGVAYDDLSKEIKNLVLVYFYKHKAKRSDVHNALDVIHHTVDLIRGRGVFSLPYDSMIESYQLFSGNLDAKKIRKIMDKYGIEITENHGKKLQIIKNGRNSLAHGNKSFEDYGRNIVVGNMVLFLEDVKNFLNEVIEKSSEFLCNEKYKISEI